MSSPPSSWTNVKDLCFRYTKLDKVNFHEMKREGTLGYSGSVPVILSLSKDQKNSFIFSNEVRDPGNINFLITPEIIGSEESKQNPRTPFLKGAFSVFYFLSLRTWSAIFFTHMYPPFLQEGFSFVSSWVCRRIKKIIPLSSRTKWETWKKQTIKFPPLKRGFQNPSLSFRMTKRRANKIPSPERWGEMCDCQANAQTKAHRGEVIILKDFL